MRIGFEVFLEVAKELSITKAAENLHVTQQCASDHIKRLEKEYGVLLFERKPKMKLTPAGMIMLRSLQNIQIVESVMTRNLKDISEGIQGTFSVGISTSRAPIILPAAMKRYHDRYPNVNISFSEEDTQILEERLLSGQIDLFIGVNTSPFSDFEITTMATEEIMLVISETLLRKHFCRKEIEEMQEGADLNQFTKIPFTLSFKTGKVNHVIEEYLKYHNINLNTPYNISDSETQIMLCTTGICASLCPKMLLETAYRHNLSCEEEKRLFMLPIKNLDRKIRIELVTHRNVLYPQYVQEFMEIVKEETSAIARQNYQ